MNILNLKWQDPDNAGDCCCSPCLYFPEFMGADTVHMNHWRGLDLSKYEAVIIGGGGLLNEENIPTILTVAKAHRKVILWAVGTNSTRTSVVIPDDFGSNVFGWIRHPHPTLPLGSCPSCLHPSLGLDVPMAGLNGYVSHKDKLIAIPPGAHHTTNHQTPDGLIRFIHAHKRIVTNTYHAAYFAWLLGKDVEIVEKWSTKFDGCLEYWASIGRLTEHTRKAWDMYAQAIAWIQN